MLRQRNEQYNREIDWLLTDAVSVGAHLESDADHQNGKDEQRRPDDPEDKRQSSLALVVFFIGLGPSVFSETVTFESMQNLVIHQ